jgi:phage-related baseplate assembly protein
VAGSRLAYRFHAMSAHPDIVDVAVVSPTPGVVQLYPLVEDGLPGNAVLAAVLSACAGEKVRPLTDQVFAFSPETSEYVISASLTLYASADATTTLARAQAAAETFAAERQQALGKDIVPSQIIAALSVDGVYQVALSEPAATLVLPEQGWAHCVNIELSLAGAANG